MGEGENDIVGDIVTKSGNGDVRKIAPKSRLVDIWVGNSTIPAPGSLSEAFHGATATCDVIGLFNPDDMGRDTAF